ncbi:hypothetical protein AKJ62_02355 [candidate division MSBL1 archaeon SCGC-AAA259D14]|uniref:tRNA (cytidine(56)-2'-O)-methyltransferase n=1 Tax=candidate division MSBL1 archaeon SCGC-AAA259D14 TaxID=1698261 RepID=A0A133U6H2_9EURY|nr:hypothetical protein AKJ62_02355 [candidate division MSBL1 archaeon SCGC-AAA259D14]
MSKVVVLRLGHRPGRDKRLSTHAGLVARAFGADGIIFADFKVKKIQDSLEGVNERWGGSFFVRGGESWREVVDDWHSDGGVVAHLTMYGLPVDEKVSELRDEDILVVIGAEKVSGEVYDASDFNIAIGNQPHSEISALAIFLDRLFEGEELRREYRDAERRIVPSVSGKKVRELDG